MTLAIGLTGGVASGKSLAAAAFARRGVPVIDADRVARDVVAPGSPGLARIVEAFGREALTPGGELDRPRMRARVFADPAARRTLEQITHPAIGAALLAWRDAQTAPYVILDVPILFESGFDALVDRVLVVDVPPGLQVERLMARDGTDAALAHRMLAAQASREERLRRADDVLRNDGTVAALEGAVARLHEHYLGIARSGEKRASGLHLP